MPQPLAAPIHPPPSPQATRQRRQPAAAAATRAANDNGGVNADTAVLRAGLRLAAQHGPAAARFAHGRAEQAFFAGEREAYAWWRSVTRILDRMLAAELPATRRPRSLPAR